MRTPLLIITICLLWSSALTAQKLEIVPKQDGHPGEVLHVCFAPDGRQALSAGRDGDLILWDLPTQKFVRRIMAGGTPVGTSISPDGLQAFALLDNNVLAAWSLETGEELWRATALDGTLATFDFSPDRQYLVIGSAAGDVAVWDLLQGNVRWQTRQAAAGLYFTSDGAQVLARSADGRILAAWASESGAAVGNSRGKIQSDAPLRFKGARAWSVEPAQCSFWDFRTGASFQSNNPELLQRVAALQDFSFYGNGSQLVLAIGSQTFFTSVTPGLPASRIGSGALSVWDISQNHEIALLEAHAERVNAVAVSPDGHWLLSASDDRTLRYWQLDGFAEKAVLARRPDVETHYAFSPDFKRVASSDLEGNFTTWDWSGSGPVKAITEVEAGNSYYYNPREKVNSLCFANDNTTLVGGNRSGILRRWNTDTQGLLQHFSGDHHAEVISALDVSTDGKRVLVRSIPESRVMAINIMSLPKSAVQAVKPLDKYYTSWLTQAGWVNGWSHAMPDSDTLHYHYFEPEFHTVSLWDTESGTCLRTFPTSRAGRTAANTVRFSPDNQLALAATHGTWQAWDLGNGQTLASANGTDVFHAFHFGDAMAQALTIGTSGELVCWNLRTGDILGQLQPSGHTATASFHPSGERILALDTTGVLTEWDIATGQRLRQMSAPVLEHPQLSHSPNGRYALVQARGVVNVIDLKSEKTVLELGISDGASYPGDLFNDGRQPHQISRFEWLPDGEKALSAAYDGTIQLWHLPTGKAIAALHALGNQEWAVTTTEGLFDASPGAMKSLYYRMGKHVVELEQFKERYYEPGLLGKLLGFNQDPLRSVDGFGAVPLYPQMDATLAAGQSTLAVTLTPRTGGIGKLSIFVNGKEVLEDANPQRATALVIDLTQFAEYYLPTENNTIALRVYNEAGWLKSAALELDYQPQATARGTSSSTSDMISLRPKPALYAIVVGTSDYAGDKLDLKYADLDANYFSQALRAAAPGVYADKVAIALLNTQADAPNRQGASSKAAIRQAFADLVGKAKAQDVLVIYLSGHGVTYGTAENAQFYYLTKDIASENLSDPDIRNNYAISSTELTEWIKAIPALKQVMVIDACNSGRIVEDIAVRKDLSSTQIRALDRMKDRTGMFILTGSAADKASYEASQYGQGLLTYSLLQGMSGLALTEDKRVDVMTLFQYSRDRVPDLAKGIGGIQTPVLAFPAGGASFDIGIVEDGVDIPLAQVKPVFIRNAFQNEDSFDDELGLGQGLANYFRTITARGGQASLIYVDVNEYENAYSIKGRYTLTGDAVTVRARLFKGKMVVGDTFTLTGQANDVDALIDAIMEQIEGMLE